METENQYVELADTLIGMEAESIDWNGSFDFDGWKEKYGEESRKYLDDLEVAEVDKIKLASLIKEDIESGYWTADEHGAFFHPDMREQYGGFISHCFEKHLASLSGIGYQLNINLN